MIELETHVNSGVSEKRSPSPTFGKTRTEKSRDFTQLLYFPDNLESTTLT